MIMINYTCYADSVSISYDLWLLLFNEVRYEECVFSFQASGQLQVIEEERINNMQDLLNKYNSHQSMIGPKLVQVSDGDDIHKNAN